MDKKKYEDGYFSLEAALIFPMVLLFVTMMIFLAFYSYDRSIMGHSAYEAAMRGTSNHFKSTNEAQAEAKKAAAELIYEKLLAMGNFTYGVSVDSGSVSVNYKCNVNMPFRSWIREYVNGFSDDAMNLDITRSATRCNQTKFIRDCRVVNKFIKKMKQ
jgi:hypothetical protein